MKTKSKGFTLIELLVVVTIIGILATIILSSLSSARESARDAKRLNDVKTIQTALEMYANDNNGRYPMTGWRGSHTDSWANLEERLGTTLPVDPLNTSESNSANAAWQGNYVYGYYGEDDARHCYGRAYVIVFNLEGINGDGDNDGVTLCNNYSYNASDAAFVVGMNGDGSFATPDLSGTSK
jgi:type II secretion system protein G